MKTNPKNTVIGIMEAAFCVIVWGTTFVSTKYLLKNFSSFEILFFRYIAAYLSLWIIHPHTLKLKDKKQELTFVLAGLTGVVIYQLLENVSINFTNASNVSIIVSICPMFTAITARIFYREKSLSPQFIVGFIIAMAGVTLVTFNGVVEFHLSPLGDFLALMAGVSWGFYSLFISRMNQYGYNPVASTRRVFFYGILFMIPVAVYGSLSPSAGDYSLSFTLNAAVNALRFASIPAILNLLFLGTTASAACFIFWNGACKRLGTVKASIGVYLIPAVTVIFAFFVLDERMSLMGLAGTAFTIAGVVISSINFKSSRKNQEVTQ